MTAISGNGMIFGVAACLFGVTALSGAFAQTPSVQFAGSNQTTTLDCSTGGAQIAGSNNKLTLTGGCTMLGVLGSDNTVTVALATNTRIQFVDRTTRSPGHRPMVKNLSYST